MKMALSYLSIALIFAAAPPSILAEETNYFLVGNLRACECIPGGFDGYVLPLSKQEDIDHARYLISLGPAVRFTEGAAPLVSADVGCGKDGINRNYLVPRLPEWSWHVVKFLGFGDFAAEIYDGTATGLEGANWWSSMGTVRIGFWDYTVVRELGPVPLYVSVIPEGENLQVYWSGVGTNVVYTLEGKDSLASTNWFGIPGASWPLKTNRWVLPMANAPARFFRVRAEALSQDLMSR